MTALTRNKRFGAITGFAGPLPSPLIALGGPSNTVLHAQKTGSRLEFLGESADLGGTVLAGDNTSGTVFHVLTSAGLVLMEDTDAPTVSVSTEFDPGDGRWLARFGNFVATPLAFGGIQTVRHNTLARVAVLPNLLADTRFAAGNPATGHLWVVDGRTASIGTVKVNLTTGSLAYIGKTAAPNCREIVKVVLDDETGDLFVVCRRRIVRFTVPLTDVEDPRPTFAEDFGIARVDYTDFLAIGGGQYWIGQDSVDAPNPLPFFYGPMFGAWDPALGDNGELFVAAPRSAVWTVNSAIPVYTDVGDSASTPPVTPPPVILPDPPVITSALTSSATETVAWSYTITASGTGPITFGVTSPPAWLTGINPLTGAISGTPPTHGTENISITATNAGGTTTATLVVTVAVAIADLSAVRVNGLCYAVTVLGSRVYVAGTFTTVEDANGSHGRSNAACLDLGTGLFTAWAPVLTTPDPLTRLWADGAGVYIYVGNVATVNAVATGGPVRVDAVSGASDPSWTPTTDATVYGLVAGGSSVAISGPFVTVNGSVSRMYALLSQSTGATIASSSAPSNNSGGGMSRDGGWRGVGYTPDGSGGEASLGYDGGGQMVNGVGLISSERFLDFAVSVSGVVLGVGDFINRQVQNLPAGTPHGTPNRSYASLCDLSGAVGSELTLNDTAFRCAALPSGDFVLAGAFTAVNGDTAYPSAARVNSGGAVVPGFSITWGAYSVVRDIAVTTTGLVAVVLAGEFNTTLNGHTRRGLALLNPDTGVLY